VLASTLRKQKMDFAPVTACVREDVLCCMFYTQVLVRLTCLSVSCKYFETDVRLNQDCYLGLMKLMSLSQCCNMLTAGSGCC